MANLFEINILDRVGASILEKSSANLLLQVAPILFPLKN